MGVHLMDEKKRAVSRMDIDISWFYYRLRFYRKNYKKSRYRRKADRLVCAFLKYDKGATALITDAQWMKVKHIR